MKKVLLFFSILLFSCFCTHAAVKLPALISDNMVLQQKMKVTLWGWADAGESVEVWNSWNNRTVKTKADANGNWRVQLQTIRAGGPYEVRIKASNTITIKNVLLGEVWLCSGQSNMEFPLGKQPGWGTGVFDYEQVVANANEPLMRLFTVKKEVADTPQTDVTGYWSACTPSTAANFSAVAYYFAKKIIHTTGLPVGLIHSSWGGTPAESWTNKEVLQSDADFLPILERYEQVEKNYPALLKAYETAIAEKKQTSKKPVDPFKDSKSPCKLYNAMIHPLIPFTLKGVIWYQGESNASRAYQYRKLFPALIRSWRKEWNANLPFYFVQIAPHYQQNPEIREAQLFTYRTVANTGMAVIADTGDSLDIHPRNKEIVGNRLAAWALAKNYGVDTITYASPFYRSMKIEQDKIRMRFDFAGKGLATNDGNAVRELVIAGADKRFVPAMARIEGNSLVVWSPEIKQPVAVRYAWKHFFRVNLFSKEGWPVSPFRTDDWEGDTPDLENFPKGEGPAAIGQKIAAHFVATPHTNFGRPTPPRYITYPETCTWYGALTFAKETKDTHLLGQLAERFEPLFGSRDTLIPKPDHVDYSVFGAVPLELYMQTKEQKYLNLGKQIADKQWGTPEGPRVNAEARRFYAKGLSWQTRLWIDDMFMITALQAQAYRATGDKSYIEHAATEMVFYLDSLQRPNGLFYHAPDVPFFWGRGNGWMAVGMSEVLRSLPKNNPNRTRIMQGYKAMMASLLQYQAGDGMWRQLIDDAESWPETSCTGMFTFAFITGVKEGWLDKTTYGPAARKGWLALIKYINADNDITDVCEGTNKKNSRQYYLDRKKNTGDLHGQAPILWCATALLRK